MDTLVGSEIIPSKNRAGDEFPVIQAVTFLSPNVGGHQQPLKGSLNHPKKVTSRIARCEQGFGSKVCKEIGSKKAVFQVHESSKIL